MKEIMKRPLFVLSASFLIVSLALIGINGPVTAVAGAVFLVAGTASLIFSVKTRRAALKFAALILLAASLACALSFSAFTLRLGSAEKYDGQTVSGTVTVRENRYTSEGFGVYRASFAPDGGGSFDVILTSSEGACVPGDVLTGEIALTRLSSDGAWDERSANLPDLVFMEAEDAGLVFSRHDGTVTPSTVISSVRHVISSRFDLGLSRSAAGLSSALLVGDKSSLSPTVRRDFSRLGISHLLAISGLHLSVLLFILTKVLSSFGMRDVPRGVVSVLFIVLFAAVSGFSASVLRAGIMHAAAIAASALGKRRDPVTAVVAAGALIIAVNPFSVLDAALWLSLLAAYACVSGSVREKIAVPVTKKPSRLMRLLKPVADSAKTTVYITACTLPVTWLVFGQASILSPVSNLLYIPAITVYLWETVIYAFVAFAGIPAAPLAAVLNFTESLITRSAGAAASLRGIVRSVNGLYIGIPVFILFALAVSLPFLRGKATRARFAVPGAVVLLAAAMTVDGLAGTGTAEGAFVLGRSSDGIAVRSGSLYAAIDDSTGSSSFASLLLRESRELGACEEEVYLLTHLHPRHATAVFKTVTKTCVRRVMIPSPKSESDVHAADSIREICERYGTPLEVYEGAVMILPGVTFEPLGGYTVGRSTHPVVSYRISTASSSAVVLGPCSGDRSEAELSAANGADAVFFSSHPRARTPEDVPDARFVVVPRAAADGIPGGVTIADPDASVGFSLGKTK